MGSTKWEGVIVGYLVDSVGYRVWDLVRGVVFNTRVSIFYEAAEPRWWRKEKVGLPAQDDTQEIEVPYLQGEGGPAREDGGEQEEVDIPLPFLVEDSSDDDEDGDDGEDGWGPNDDAPMLPVHGGPPAGGGGGVCRGATGGGNGGSSAGGGGSGSN